MNASMRMLKLAMISLNMQAKGLEYLKKLIRTFQRRL